MSFSRNSDPAENAVSVTPHDTTELASGVRGLYVGGAGDVVALMPSGNVVTFKNVPAGAVLPVRCRRVNSTSTTATHIVAFY